MAGVVVAAMGLTTWKKQLTGGEEWKLARRLLRNVYKLRDTLAATPSPLITGAEMAAARDALGIEDSSSNRAGLKTSNDDLIAAYEVRWRGVANAFSAYRVEELEAEVLWGSPAKDATQDLNRFVQNLQSQVERRIWELQDEHSNGRGTLGETVFTSSEERQKYKSQLGAAVEKAESFTRQKLKR